MKRKLSIAILLALSSFQLLYSQIQVFSDGRVGINSSDPGGKLLIKDASIPSSIWNQNKTAIEVQAFGSQKSVLQADANLFPYRIALTSYSNSSGIFNFVENSTNVYYTSNGTGNDVSRRQANGKATLIRQGSNGHIYLRTAGSAASGEKILWRNGLIVNYGGNVGIGGFPLSGTKFTVHGEAKKPGGGEFLAFSDERLKKNIQSFDFGLNEILEINPVFYEYDKKFITNSSNKKYIGVIAQEIQKVGDFMVSEDEIITLDYDEDGNEVKENHGKYLQVDASPIKYMLVNAIKEQQKIIEDLTHRLEVLEQNCEQNDAHTLGNEDTKIILNNSGEEKPKLLQNKPNPFTNATEIQYYLPPSSSSNALIKVFDSNGKILSEEVLVQRGWGTISIDANNAENGNYIYSLIVNDIVVDSKIMLIKK